MEPMYWIFLWLVCFCASASANPDEIVLIDDGEVSLIEDPALKIIGDELCSPCQCQCEYPPSNVKQEVSLLIQEQLTAIEEKLDEQSASFDEVAKQLSSVQHDLESPRAPQCPDDFLYDQQTNLCFQLHVADQTKKLTFAEAQRYCQHLGPKTQLLTLDTVEKVEVLREHLKQARDKAAAHVWVGGMQIQGEGRWFWTSTGQPLSEEIEALWLPDNPSNSGGSENCLDFHLPGPNKPRLLWGFNDLPCQWKIFYICERQMN